MSRENEVGLAFNEICIQSAPGLRQENKYVTRITDDLATPALRVGTH